MLFPMRFFMIFLFIPTLVFSNTSLINAAKKNSLEKAVVLLEKDPDLSRVDSKGYSALHYSILNNNKKIFDMLIDAGSTVNFKKNLLFTSLESNDYFTNVLLDKNIKINSLNNEQQTPLIIAVIKGKEEIVQKLVGLKANISHKDTHGYRAIDYAFKHNYISMAPVLYSSRWSKSIKNKLYEDAIMLYPIDALEFLLGKGLNPNYKFSNSETSLIVTIKGNQADKFELLLNSGANVNFSDKERNTPIMHAITSGNQLYVDYILEYGAKINLKNIKGQDAYELALDKENPDIDTLFALIDLGANVNFVSPNGNSVLNLVAQRGFSDELQYLIESNADVNIQDKNGNTPLIIAARNGYVSISEILIDNGAEINQLNYSFESPFSIAKEIDNKDLKTLFFMNGARSTSQNLFASLSESFRNKDYASVKKVLNYGNNNGYISLRNFPLLNFAVKQDSNELIEIIINDKQTYNELLVYSAKNDNINAVKFLIEQGVDLTDNKLASEVLATVIENGSKKVFSYLLRNDIPLNWVNVNGDTPVLIACEHGEIKMAKSLIKKGAKYDIKNINGYTAEMVAEEKGYSTLIKEML